MQILKYFFLLFLLSCVATTIFIATQKGDFEIKRSKVINAPRNTVYQYINDLSNWPNFNKGMINDPNLKVTYSKNSSGIGASSLWTGVEGSGDIQTISTKTNENIFQKVNNNGTVSNVSWHFKDTVGGTKVTWKTIGKLSFELKFYATLKGGVEKNIGKSFEESLLNLDKILDYETNTYSVKIEGEVSKTTTHYLSQTFHTKVANIGKNSKIVFNTILEYCSKNGIATYGKPFIIVYKYDKPQEIAKVSFCIPIPNELIVTEKNIKYGKLNSFPAIKTILKGDYSHVKQALSEINAYYTQKAILRDKNFSHLEIYTIGRNEINQPSKWVTYIYTPIVKKVVTIPTTRPYQVKNQPQPETIAPEVTEEDPLDF